MARASRLGAVDGAAHLEGVLAAAASQRDLQALQPIHCSSRRCPRHRWALSQSARPRDGALHRREVTATALDHTQPPCTRCGLDKPSAALTTTHGMVRPHCLLHSTSKRGRSSASACRVTVQTESAGSSTWSRRMSRQTSMYHVRNGQCIEPQDQADPRLVRKAAPLARATLRPPRHPGSIRSNGSSGCSPTIRSGAAHIVQFVNSKQQLLPTSTPATLIQAVPLGQVRRRHPGGRP